MNKSTKEILGRRAPPSEVFFEDGGTQVFLYVKDQQGLETHAVTVNESVRSFNVGRVEEVKPNDNQYRVRDWREALYRDAIHALLVNSGRYHEPKICVILGEDVDSNKYLLKSALRMGAGHYARLVVIGDHEAGLMDMCEICCEVEYLPKGSPEITGQNVVVLKANGNLS